LFDVHVRIITMTIEINTESSVSVFAHNYHGFIVVPFYFRFFSEPSY